MASPDESRTSHFYELALLSCANQLYNPQPVQGVLHVQLQHFLREPFRVDLCGSKLRSTTPEIPGHLGKN